MRTLLLFCMLFLAVPHSALAAGLPPAEETLSKPAITPQPGMPDAPRFSDTVLDNKLPPAKEPGYQPGLPPQRRPPVWIGLPIQPPKPGRELAPIPETEKKPGY